MVGWTRDEGNRNETILRGYNCNLNIMLGKCGYELSDQCVGGEPKRLYERQSKPLHI